ncbi:MAG: hypothetical protein OEY19_13325 [Gammaproteobacteria bacterium]|nr:hypothetical protein [Gammaproteobacteria bacterium]MDH5631046.1 hypothetical protein [Gammaproteobacteria bacterium]
MKNIELKIDQQLNQMISELKSLSYETLKDLVSSSEKINIDGREFEFLSWSEPAVDKGGYIAILVETSLKHLLFSSRPRKGFVINSAGNIRDLSEDETWEYD